jgi:hypothetical protein
VVFRQKKVSSLREMTGRGRSAQNVVYLSEPTKITQCVGLLEREPDS